MCEERKSVKAKGYEYLYDVSRSGRIINKKTNIVKKLYGMNTALLTFIYVKMAVESYLKPLSYGKKYMGE